MLLVANPKAGRCTTKEKLFDIIALFSKNGYTVTVYPTKREGTVAYVKEASPLYDIVVCCGGDGTLSEVISGVYASGVKTPIGYIPMGSTNDFAVSLGLPKNPMLAARAIINGKASYHDIGTINGRVFSYIAGTGAFTKASYCAPQKMKNSLGHFAYIIEGAKCLAQIKPFRLKAVFDGKKIEGDYIYASASNTTSFGGLVNLGRDAVCFTDGKFEFLLVKKPKSFAQATELITNLLSNKLKGACFELHHVGNMEMHLEKPMYFTVDGEKSDPYQDVVIKNRRKAIRLILPRKASRFL